MEVITTALIALVSFFYTAAGQAGGTAYLAIMSLMNFTSDEMRPTGLLLNIVAASYSTWRLHMNRSIDYELLARLTIPSLPAVFLGSLIVLPSNYYFLITGLILLAAAALTVSKPLGKIVTSDVGLLSAGLVGLVTGFFSGLTGVGGGVFLAPILIGMGWLLPKRAVALCAPFILINSVLGLVVILFAGQTVAKGAPFYAIGALVGACFGTWFGLRFMSDRLIRAALSGLLLVAGLRLVLSLVY